MKSEKGITLIALVFTIIILFIIASIATYSGVNTIRFANFNKAKSEMELMQATVDSWNMEYNSLKTDNTKSKEKKQKDYINEHGVATNDSSCDQTVLTKTVEATGISSEDFRFLSGDFLKNNLEFDTEFISIGDGIGISRRKS